MTAAASANGLIRIESRHSTPITAQRLEALLNEAGVRIFTRIDFSADAKAAGLDMHPEILLLFGNPKAGTPLMIEQPSVGIDLPLNDPGERGCANRSQYHLLLLRYPSRSLPRRGLVEGVGQRICDVLLQRKEIPTGSIVALARRTYRCERSLARLALFGR